ncbi:MAG: alanine/glycine:cation symporter family protein [Gemmatimonadota bacterium]
MQFFEQLVNTVSRLVWEEGIPMGGEEIPFVVVALLGVGIFLTVRMGFVQIRHFFHGAAVASGKYDDPEDTGDVTHFQALTTALSATVGIGNIAGVAIAIHWGGPGALFWMWVTAFLGMATKFTEVTLAQHYREVVEPDAQAHRWEGTVSGGPMYYIERGLGARWRWLALLFAILLGITAFLTGNGIQANTVADAMQTNFGIPPWMSGLVTTAVVGAVILGGITRIGRVTGVLAPLMAAIYVLGALWIILVNVDQLIPSIALIFREAFNPSAGVAGTGVGAFLVTMMWGVRRGLFSNEAGQGSAPIAHAAAKTEEPVSEGVVALLEPFIDTIVICTITAMVIIMTGVWDDRVPTAVTLQGGDLSYRTLETESGYVQIDVPEEIRIENGEYVSQEEGDPLVAWHEAPVDELYEDPAMTRPFTGTVYGLRGEAVSVGGETFTTLHGLAAESGAPLTMLGFQRGLPGRWGDYIVILSVLLFAISTSISWSYYGDRCAYYVLGADSVLPYKLVFLLAHFLGALVSLEVAWTLGDTFLGLVILPNLVALMLLSGKVKEILESYFEREAWRPDAEPHRRWAERRAAERASRSERSE